MNRFGYNYLGVPDVTEEMRHAHAIDAGGGLFFQTQIDFARRFKSERPQSNVVIRNWPDRSVPASVDDWLKSNRPLAEGDLIVQVNNEVGLIDKNIQFHEALLERVKRDKIKMKLGLFATSVGTPDPDHDWPRAERVLQLANDLYDQTFMIHHEYWGGVVTSGFFGGDPTMIQPDTWPKDTRNITMWHLGRYRFLKAYQRLKGRPMLRTIIGENGTDFTGDIGKWLTELKSTKGQYDIVDGWRDLWDQWRAWWTNKDAATAYMDQLAYEDKYIYIDPEIETILLFARWNDGSWGTYQTNPELDKKMEDYAKSLSTTPPAPVEPTLPVDLGQPITVRIEGDSWFLRSEPRSGASQIGLLIPGEEVKLYPATTTLSDGMSWKVVERTIPVISETRRGWSAFPTPAQPPPDTTPSPDADAIARIAITRAKIHAMASLLEGIVADLAKLEADMVAKKAA